jgi:hypothetical protein
MAKSGLMPPNRSELTEQIDSHLKQLGFVRVTPPQRVVGSVAPLSNNAFFPASTKNIKEKQRQAREKHSAIAKTVSKRVRLELWYQSDTVLDSLVTAVTEMLGLKKQGKAFRRKRRCEWETPELTVELSAFSLGILGDELEDAEKGRRRSLWRRAESVEQHIKRIAPSADEEKTITGAIIEIAAAKQFTKPSDPKDGIRAGFAQAERVTQFINPGESELKYRAKMAVLDLLRQLGVQSGLPLPSTKTFRQPISYAAVWLFKPHESAKSFLPMMLWMKGDGSEVRATALGLGEFKPYPEFLKKLAQRNATTYLSYNERHRIPAIFREWLQELQKQKDEDILLLVHGQKTRVVWPWLKNPMISLDSICFGQDGQLRPMAEWPGLRIIRVRDSDSSETPESFAYKEEFEGVSSERRMSYTQGLFQSNERVFYSVSKKPKQRRSLRANQSKTTEPDLHAWNPGIVEFSVACVQPEDQPWSWAMLAHRLREAAVHSDDPITLPLPLHLLSVASEYALIGAESNDGSIHSYKRSTSK